MKRSINEESEKTMSDTSAPERVLIVDDDDINRRVLRAILRKDHYEVLEARNGQEAITQAWATPPQLVLLDVVMPGQDGYTVFSQLKQLPALADVPVIFLSSRDEPADKVRALDLGASDYVTKPFDTGEVRARVRTQLRLLQLTRSLQSLNSELRARQELLEEDLRAAADIQRALIPRTRSVLPGFHTAWLFEPCNAVGGDLLNIHPLGLSHVGVYVLDVSGHGVPSAMVTASVARSLSPDGGIVLRDKPQQPVTVLQELEREYPFERFARFFTLCYMLVDTRQGLLRYSSAGHPPPILLPRGGSPRPLPEGGPPVGLGLGAQHAEGELRLTPGDRLFLYTDGVVDATGPDDQPLGLERFHAILEAHRTQPLTATCDAVLQAIRAHQHQGPSTDDITLLALEYQGLEPRG
jgi:sigma-B regulation protein RsbU (phosphoserine phosphatase)